MKEVSPLGLLFLRSFILLDLRGLLERPLAVDLELMVDYLLLDFDTLGPFSRLFLTNLAACSFVKQSQMPSHAIIMKSMSFFIGTFVTSGKLLT